MAEADAAPEREADGRPAADGDLVAAGEERFLPPARPRLQLAARGRFLLLLLLALGVHVALIAAFLLRDRTAPTQVAEIETPVEVIVEPPPPPPAPAPEPPKPPEQKPPEPPKPRPREDLSPAMSAPRAPNQDNVKTDAKEAKSTAPTKMPTPTLGQPQAPAPAATPPDTRAPTPPDKEDTAKEEDKSKPAAEALDKARQKAAKAKQNRTREAKAAPKRKSVSEALASLGGAPDFGAMSFARPTPKTKIYGGTEDVRWMSEVEAMLEAKVQQLPRTAHWQAGGHVAICFHVDVSGRVTVKEWCQKSGYPDIDQIAMRALVAAAPFPPPPPGVEHGLIWSSVFDGQLPVLHISKR